MEKLLLLKETFMQTKTKIAVAVAAIIAALVAFKKVLTGDSKSEDITGQEEQIKQDAEAKIAEEAAKLEEKRKAELAKILADQEAAQEKVNQEAAAQEDSLKKLSKTDKEAFKKEVEKKLGVQQSKRGRKKK